MALSGMRMNAAQAPVAPGALTAPSTPGTDRVGAAAGGSPKFSEVMSQIQAQSAAAQANRPKELKKTLTKDDFLKIMVTQMKHQDPTKPMDADKLAQEMSSMASVEQLQNMNSTLTKMTTQNQPLEKLAMTNMIGKSVIIDRSRIPHKEGSPESFSVKLPQDAAAVNVTIVSDSGEVVSEQAMGPNRAGQLTVRWDGKKNGTINARAGNYLVKIEAKSGTGATIPVGTQTQARVSGISFEGGEPVFLLGDPKSPEKVTLANITRIEQGGGGAEFTPNLGGAASMNPTAQNNAAEDSVPVQPSGNSNFFTFEKGVGSRPLEGPPPKINSGDASVPIRSPIMASNRPGPMSAAPAEAPAFRDEPGFPNGLSPETGPKGGVEE